MKIKILLASAIAVTLLGGFEPLAASGQTNTAAPIPPDITPPAATLSLTNNPLVNLFANIPVTAYNLETFDVSIGSELNTVGPNLEQVYKGLYCFGTNSEFAVGADLFAGQGSQYADAAHAIFQIQKCQAQTKVYGNLFAGENFLLKKPEGGAGVGGCYRMGSLGCGLEGRITISSLNKPPGIGPVFFVNWSF